MNKNFLKLREYSSHVKGNFSITALTETWCIDDQADKNSLWQLPNYTGGIALDVHSSLNFKILKNKNINNIDIECYV